MAKFSQKVMGKEVGEASVYAAPHNMSGKAVSGQTPEMPYMYTKAAKNITLKDPIPNGVSLGQSELKSDGIVTRGNGAATKGTKARGPMC
ncbi:MAG: hypothetical protein WCK82_12450 [Bacteroidota bacterium]|jgi:hypothetical protein